MSDLRRLIFAVGLSLASWPGQGETPGGDAFPQDLYPQIRIEPLSLCSPASLATLRVIHQKSAGFDRHPHWGLGWVKSH